MRPDEDEGLNMPGAREATAEQLPDPEVQPAVTEAPAVLSREAIVTLIEKYEQIAKSGASYSEHCHEFVADLKELI